MEFAILSDRIDANEAERLGVINRVVPAAELAQETVKLAERLAKGATKAIARTKLLLNQSLDSSLESQLQAEGIGFGACAATSDMVEGVNAFLEKRAPDFANR
jgi:2-(1,2-epoxy-1,2-dihydrophenyl)acetyl-CoA isomerase